MLLQRRRIQKEVCDRRDRLEELVGERTADLAREIAQRKQAHEALQGDRERLRQALALQEKERRLIAYEIHDGLAQQLAAAIMQLQSLRSSATKASAAVQPGLDVVQRLLEDGLKETRGLINGLRPPALDEDGVEAAIRELIARDGFGGQVRIELHCDMGTVRLATVLENAIFRIVQEGLSNARRHSRSERVRIGLAAKDGIVSIEIRDWGVGFDPAGVGEDHFGLEGIRERARLFGGEAAIRSAVGEGTRIFVTLPVDASVPC